MSELFLVRHAQASYGADDYDRLSELGHQQARWLGEHFRYRNLQFDLVICGDMVRHHETLEGIASGMGEAIAEYSVHSQWNEFDFESLIEAYLTERPDQRPDPGAVPGEFMRVLRKALQAWADEQLMSEIPETWIDFERRVREALEMATQQAGPGRKILVVSSGGAISMALKQVLMTPPGSMIEMNLQTRNSSFSHLFFNRKSTQLSGFNHAPHLDHPERSHALTYY